MLYIYQHIIILSLAAWVEARALCSVVCSFCKVKALTYFVLPAYDIGQREHLILMDKTIKLHQRQQCTNYNNMLSSCSLYTVVVE